MIIKRIFIVSLLAQSLAFAGNSEIKNQACWNNPIFTHPMDIKKGEEILNQYNKTHAKKLPETMDEDGNRNELKLQKVYYADINNDGKLEYILVFEDQVGTLHLETLFVFQKNGNEINYLGDIPKPDTAGDGYFYAGIYDDRGHRQDQFLTQLCGKTYSVFDEFEAYLWKAGVTKDACDSDWANFERFQFQKQYAEHHYDEAFTQLNTYATRCKNQMEPNIYLWIQNELALASLKSGNAQTCQTILQEIEKHPAYSKTSPLFQKTVNFNKKLCLQQLSHPVSLDKPHGEQEYAWVFDKSLTQRQLNLHFRKLILQTAPNAIFSTDEYQSKKTIAAEIREYYYYARINYKPDDLVAIQDFEISDHRYYFWQAAWPHDAGQKAFIWVDTKEGTSLLGFNHPFYITSRNFHADTVPLAAKRDIKNKLELSSSPEHAVFYDMETNQQVTLSKEWWG